MCVVLGETKILMFHWSVRLIVAFAITVSSVFSLLKIHYQDFYYPLDMYVFRSGASSSMKEGSRRQSFYVGATFITPQFQHKYIHSVLITMDSVHPSSLPCTN